MTQPSLTLIRNGEVYNPQPQGVQSLLLAGATILAAGEIDPAHLRTVGVPYQVVDASDCIVTPGLVDPHAHIIGAGGEEGFASRMPEVAFEQLASAGVTTVVGLLGTDTTTRHLSSLLAKARQLEAQGITAYIFTGGFKVPPLTLTQTVMDDLVLIDKVIGVGEIAISDFRSTEPSTQELARHVSEAILGGLLGGKCGVTHFHTGEGERRLRLLHELMDVADIPGQYLYPGHVARTRELLDDAIKLAQRGAFLDTDTVEENVAETLTYYWEHGGPPDRLSISSDAHTPGGTPHKFFQQLVSCAIDHSLEFSRVLPHFTQNAARILKLSQKGTLEVGKDADLLLLDKETLALRQVFARGRCIFPDTSADGHDTPA